MILYFTFLFRASDPPQPEMQSYAKQIHRYLKVEINFILFIP